MSFRRKETVDVICDGCGKVKSKEQGEIGVHQAPWAMWIDAKGRTWHHCPDCAS